MGQDEEYQQPQAPQQGYPAPPQQYAYAGQQQQGGPPPQGYAPQGGYAPQQGYAQPPQAQYGGQQVQYAAQPAPYVVQQPSYIVTSGYQHRPLGESGDICLGILLAWCIGWFGYFALMCREVSHRFIQGLHIGNALVNTILAIIMGVLAAVICDMDENDYNDYDGDYQYRGGCTIYRTVCAVFACIFGILAIVFTVLARKKGRVIRCHPQYHPYGVQQNAQFLPNAY
eukprot:TRINITY_DN3413_c0_g1_i2.p1 TRINITY_DN3413_c0_g1~~TRINITY_DN3413_c0_g1_i2.p1  ORF type:complete len:227 (+),score=41.15 TRINITY_DN3413_c0_g1_i2:179-859(+)